MKAITETQNQLLNKLIPVFNASFPYPVKYDDLKKAANVKSFDNSFNALMHKGWVFKYPTKDFSNPYLLNRPK